MLPAILAVIPPWFPWPPVNTQHDAYHGSDQSRNVPRQYSSYHGHNQPHPRRRGPRHLEQDRTRAAFHRRRLDSLGITAVQHQPDNLLPPPAAPLPQVGLVDLPRAGLPADDSPYMAGNPADPLHPPAQLSYSAVAQIYPKTLARPSDQPGSPAGWGAVDPTRADCDSDIEESASPLPLLPSYPLHTGSPAPLQKPTPVRQQNGADLSSVTVKNMRMKITLLLRHESGWTMRAV